MTARPALFPASDIQSYICDLLDAPDCGLTHHTLFNITVAIRITPCVDLRRLERAFHRLQQRHDVLRTRFRRDTDGWKVQILDKPRAKMCLHKLHEMSDHDQIQALLPLTQERYNLTSAPLLRLDLLRFGAAGDIAAVRGRVEEVSDALGRRIKILVGKPGLDGHSNGAEQIAVRARDAGMEVVYEGIRLTPEQIVSAARDEAVHVVGLSVLSGSHVALVTDVMDLMRAEGLDDIPVVAGGIIPPADAETLKAAGVARVYTPKDFDLTAIMDQIVDLAAEGLPTAAE